MKTESVLRGAYFRSRFAFTRHANTLDSVLKTGRVLSTVALALIVVGASTACAPVRSAIANGTPIPHPTQSTTPTPTPTPTPTGFNKQALSIDAPTSYWVVVDKLRPLNPKTYTPPDLVNVSVPHVYGYQMRAAASAALTQMFAAGKAAGAGAMEAQSAYRSYAAQARDYAALLARDGQKVADNESAHAGYSEHQTGLAVDIAPLPSAGCNLEVCFGTTPQGRWLAANAYRYGYLLRYPADKVAITGYTYEPWHFRYIGTSLATEMHNEGVETLEEFFGLPAAPNYIY